MRETNKAAITLNFRYLIGVLSRFPDTLSRILFLVTWAKSTRD